ncbi:MAG TPA: MerR family transcriptional regulator [Tessaracoccus flavescens]|uniref:MerR family transcriptional regulator n=1 Tax=Tessaracoccus flavescens TaxID=399497 RepID=A0A921EPT0_9ACTN|nr:MerR family transcriptional regulator [Tessaracoccus flavescens]
MQESQARYTVKQVAALTGVRETTLRVWERRYDVVTPHRSPSGYRLYDNNHVRALRAMASLVDDGVPASIAAETIKNSHAATPDRPTIAAYDLVAAATSLEPARLDGVLAEALAAAPIDHVADEWLLPELERLGDAWASGEASVAHEHFAAAGVIRALSKAYQAAGSPASDHLVLMGLPEGSHHELGLMSFASCLREHGIAVAYLGADVPLDDWIKAASDLKPRAAVVGVPQSANVTRAQALVDRLSELAPPVSIWVGGGRSEKIQRAHQLPHRMSDAATELATALSSGAA